MRTDDKSIIERVKTEFGGAVGLASKLNERNPDRALTPQAISQWKRVPAERAIDVEAVTGIPRQELRPDIYGATSRDEAAA